MTIGKFRDKFNKEFESDITINQLRHLEAKGIFSVPRINNGRDDRDYSKVYKQVMAKIIDYKIGQAGKWIKFKK